MRLVRRIVDGGRRAVGTRREYRESRDNAARYAEHYPEVEAFCLFIGYPRSGHSLVGSLLDAHPETAIAHERDAARDIDKGFSREQLYYLILENTRAFAESGRSWSGYDYQVPGQWNGRFRRLRVIGDKKGDATSRRLGRRPGLLATMREDLGVPIKLVHVVRNPWDNVASMARRDGTSLAESMRRYLRMCHAAQRVRKSVADADWLDIHHDDLIADPRGILTELCGFLGVTAPADYLGDCAEVVFSAPEHTRSAVQWTQELRQRLARELAPYPAFARYRFDDGSETAETADGALDER